MLVTQDPIQTNATRKTPRRIDCPSSLFREAGCHQAVDLSLTIHLGCGVLGSISRSVVEYNTLVPVQVCCHSG